MFPVHFQNVCLHLATTDPGPCNLHKFWAGNPDKHISYEFSTQNHANFNGRDKIAIVDDIASCDYVLSALIIVISRDAPITL